jgi:hypothetical protein
VWKERVSERHEKEPVSQTEKEEGDRQRKKNNKKKRQTERAIYG